MHIYKQIISAKVQIVNSNICTVLPSGIRRREKTETTFQIGNGPIVGRVGIGARNRMK